MQFDPINCVLSTDDGRFIKRVHCPRNLAPGDLLADSADDFSRTCVSCQSRVVNLSGLSDEAALALVQQDPAACVFAQAGVVKIVMPTLAAKIAGEASSDGQSWVSYVADTLVDESARSLDDEPKRIIRTARGVQAINKAISKGFWPLVRVLKAAPHIQDQVIFYQHRESGEIHAVNYLNANDFNPETCRFDPAIYRKSAWLKFSPIDTSAIVAAYLLPADLRVGEMVKLNNLIEHIVGLRGPQSQVRRLLFANAIWRGDHFEILVPPAGELLG